MEHFPAHRVWFSDFRYRKGTAYLAGEAVGYFRMAWSRCHDFLNPDKLGIESRLPFLKEHREHLF